MSENETFVRDLFNRCETLKKNREDRQTLLDHYEQIILHDLDFAIEQKIEHDLWTLIFKNEMNVKQESIKDPAEKRAELQTFYNFAKGFYLKLFQDVLHTYHFSTSICPLSYPLIVRPSARKCKEASILYFLQHILVHVGDLNRYSNQIDLAEIFYRYAIETIPYLGQPYNQIGILHEMKNPQSTLTLAQHQLISMYFYIRSIAIKVPFPLAKANLEKLFLKFQDNSKNNDGDFHQFFLQIVASIYSDGKIDQLDRFRSLILSNFNLKDFIQILSILFFTLHRSVGLIPSYSSPLSDKAFDLTLELLIIIVEQCLEAIQMPLEEKFIDEQDLLPILYLTFAFFNQFQKWQCHFFEHRIFHEKISLWNHLAKLLRSFRVASNIDQSTFFLQYQHVPLDEERTLQAFTPFNELFKGYDFKISISNEENFSEKDQRQLRKCRLVWIFRNLSQRRDEKNSKNLFDHLICSINDQCISFEPKIPSSTFGAPGDRRTRPKTSSDEQRTGKVVRGTRNVALRQFLDPSLLSNAGAKEEKSPH